MQQLSSQLILVEIKDPLLHRLSSGLKLLNRLS